MKYTYLLINLFTVLGPLLGSMDRRVNFLSKWKYAIPATFIAAIPFWLWDVIFTSKGIWGFNEEYCLRLDLVGMPVEEWLFFFTVPFACLLIYETVCTLRPSVAPGRIIRAFTTTIGMCLMAMAIVFSNQMYTFVAFSLAGALLILHGLILRKKYLSNFWIAFLIHLIPFFIVNGLLTWLPVVWYNNHENFGVRIGTIPVEDIIYSLLLLLTNVTVYEWLTNKSK